MRATLVFVLGFVLLASGASAKGGVGGLRFCGADGCWDVNQPADVTELLAAVAAARAIRAPGPSPYFTVRYLVDGGGLMRPQARLPELYYVPRARAIQRRVGVRGWAALGGANDGFARAVWGWRPFRPTTARAAQPSFRR